MSNNNRTALRRAYILALSGYFGLFTLLIAWLGWLSPPQALPKSLVMVLFIGPLLLPLRGLLHARHRTFVWTTLLALLYMLHGVVEAYSTPQDRLLAMAEIGFSLMLYLGAFIHARITVKAAKRQAPDEQKAP